MPKLPICPYCGNPIEKDRPTKKYDKRTYHANCYSKMCEELYGNSHDRGIGTPKRTSNTSQEELYDYICSLFNIKELNGLLSSQLKNIFAEHDYTYSGVMMTLKYFFEIKDNKPDLKYGIGIVPFVYEDAKEFFIKKRILMEKCPRVVDKMPEKTVFCTPHTHKNPRFVDIDKL